MVLLLTIACCAVALPATAQVDPAVLVSVSIADSDAVAAGTCDKSGEDIVLVHIELETPAVGIEFTDFEPEEVEMITSLLSSAYVVYRSNVATINDDAIIGFVDLSKDNGLWIDLAAVPTFDLNNAYGGGTVAESIDFGVSGAVENGSIYTKATCDFENLKVDQQSYIYIPYTADLYTLALSFVDDRFVCDGVEDMIARLPLEYLNFENITSSREQLKAYHDAQWAVLPRLARERA